MVKDTESYNNSYDKWGNIAQVKHWFGKIKPVYEKQGVAYHGIRKSVDAKV